ncbi:uncharacterized protein [Parasteatoda tepidariorum]|uniref:uncharacterized protein n=1 Tax=Parasteatoda tepidariorum TaxID=114398 RepID=UPI0039BCD26D
MKLLMTLIFAGCAFIIIEGLPVTSEDVKEQAEQDYNHHQELIKNSNQDLEDKVHRDRGYAYEKAYAYSRETAYLDFYDDKGTLNAEDIVKKFSGES